LKAISIFAPLRGPKLHVDFLHRIVTDYVSRIEHIAHRRNGSAGIGVAQ
jgi:hypothetical protein